MIACSKLFKSRYRRVNRVIIKPEGVSVHVVIVYIARPVKKAVSALQPAYMKL